jgi:hypothetical protein
MYGILHIDGSGEDNPPLDRLPALYDELKSEEFAAGDVAVINDDLGWSMSAYRDGRVVLEHLRDGGQRHLIPVQRERVLELWRRLIMGDLQGILAEPWKSGYS